MGNSQQPVMTAGQALVTPPPTPMMDEDAQKTIKMLTDHVQQVIVPNAEGVPKKSRKRKPSSSEDSTKEKPPKEKKKAGKSDNPKQTTEQKKRRLFYLHGAALVEQTRVTELSTLEMAQLEDTKKDQLSPTGAFVFLEPPIPLAVQAERKKHGLKPLEEPKAPMPVDLQMFLQDEEEEPPKKKPKTSSKKKKDGSESSSKSSKSSQKMDTSTDGEGACAAGAAQDLDFTWLVFKPTTKKEKKIAKQSLATWKKAFADKTITDKHVARVVALDKKTGKPDTEAMMHLIVWSSSGHAVSLIKKEYDELFKAAGSGSPWKELFSVKKSNSFAAERIKKNRIDEVFPGTTHKTGRVIPMYAFDAEFFDAFGLDGDKQTLRDLSSLSLSSSSPETSSSSSKPPQETKISSSFSATENGIINSKPSQTNSNGLQPSVFAKKPETPLINYQPPAPFEGETATIAAAKKHVFTSFHVAAEAVTKLFDLGAFAPNPGRR